MYLLIEIEIDRSNFSKAEELKNNFKKICSSLCDKLSSIDTRLKEFEKKMRLEDSLNKILIIDFGSQFTQLIARKIRELGIYCEIISHNKINKKLKLDNNVKGIILSGGPLNVYQNKKVKFNKDLLHANIPVLGICFGHQIISKEMGGKVKQSKYREFGLAKVKKIKNSILTNNFFLLMVKAMYG